MNTVEALAEAKFAVARTLSKDGVLVLNADDPLVVLNGLKVDREVCWFSLKDDNDLVLNGKKEGLKCCWVRGPDICYFNGQNISLKVPIKDIPITMGGAAKFNIQNAMGALCLAKAMGLSNEAIKTGLTTFSSTPEDNPGRCNEFKVKGARVFVDFAHNPHSLDAIADMLNNIPAQNKYLLIGQAGDRTDQEIRDLVSAALTFKPNKVMAVEFLEYLRGREAGEVSDLIKKECLKFGINAQDILTFDTPLEGTKTIMKNIQKGDVALLLALADRDKVFDYLKNIDV